jgi:glycosyltransferase involved in cell wall biosynthesis
LQIINAGKLTIKLKKVLILAYDFPPYVSVGGLRPLNWYKLFTEFGVFPVVVTRQWDNKYKNSLDYIAPSASTQVIVETTQHGTIIKTPYKANFANRLYLKYGNKKYVILRKAVSAYYEFAQYVFRTGPKAELYFAADEYLKNNKVDCIIATVDPFVLLKYASDLGRRHNTPWIADYRDPWSQDLQFKNNLFAKTWYSTIEKKILRNVSLITTVSAFCEKHIATLAPPTTPFYIIPNGYDEAVIDKAKGVKQESEILNLAFVGTIYKWHPIRSFCRVISEFISATPDAKICLNFYGLSLEDELYEMIDNEFPLLKNYLKIHKKVKNELFIAELARNNIMVLFNHYSIIGTKIYEFVGIQRLILLCYSNDPEAEALKKAHFNLNEGSEDFPQLQSELINETHSGIVVKDAEHLKTTIADLYSNFKHDGLVKCKSINATQFSRKIQTQRLAEIVKYINQH